METLYYIYIYIGYPVLYIWLYMVIIETLYYIQGLPCKTYIVKYTPVNPVFDVSPCKP